HLLFKQFVHQMRPALDINSVATGEHWYGTQALEKGLVDAVGTSDDLIIDRLEKHQVIGVRYTPRKRMMDRFINSTPSIMNICWRWSRKLSSTTQTILRASASMMSSRMETSWYFAATTILTTRACRRQ
ncbi:hypothetical protein EWM58_05250, partial [Candidatus Erwinia dacicola]|nr:hypothetical protein [Candidatus Erwinia dacicola]